MRLINHFLVVRLNWAMEYDFRAHLARIKRHLDEGRRILESIHGGSVNTYDVPDATPDLSVTYLDPPLPGDKSVHVQDID